MFVKKEKDPRQASVSCVVRAGLLLLVLSRGRGYDVVSRISLSVGGVVPANQCTLS